VYTKCLCIHFDEVDQVLIDGKNKQGKRINLSIDDTLYGLFKIQCENGNKDARQIIKERIKNGEALNSKTIREYLLLEIARPSLVNKYLGIGDEYQTDIEDFI